jgi:hypothetical protein
MSDELKAMLEGLTTDELKEVQTVVGDLISIAEEEDDGQPDEMKEQQDFANDEVPFESDDRPF